MRHSRKQESVTHSQEKMQAIENACDRTQMSDLIEKEFTLSRARPRPAHLLGSHPWGTQYSHGGLLVWAQDMWTLAWSQRV